MVCIVVGRVLFRSSVTKSHPLADQVGLDQLEIEYHRENSGEYYGSYSSDNDEEKLLFPKNIIKMVFHDIDKNNDNGLSRDEFEGFIKSISHDNKADQIKSLVDD